VNSTFCIPALLSHQAERCLKLEQKLKTIRKEVDSVQLDVVELEKKLKLKKLIVQGKITVRFTISKTMGNF